ncbi:unnamed protein product, partial [Iphiclides podalirius]
MRVNMSMAIVDMTDVTKEDHFDWSYNVQSMILSSFFWGYIVLMLPSGELAKRFGGKRLLTIAIAANALVSLLLPTGAYLKHRTPLMKIITCLPFWAAVVGHCGQNWGFFTLMTEMPTYMAKVLNVNLKQNGVLSSLPYLAMYSLSFPVGALTDFLVRRKLLSVTNTRKLTNTIGFWGPALALIGLSYTPEGNMVAAVVMLTVTGAINAGHYTGYLLILVDLAPNFSSWLMAISNFFANIVSLIAPLVCGIIIQDEWVVYLPSAPEGVGSIPTTGKIL